MAASKINKTTKMYKQIKGCWQQVLEGTFLAIDPSSGSSSSMPGYAVFLNGNLVESGIISVSPAAKKNTRLFGITDSLRTEFDHPDVIAIENIPPMTFKGGGMSGWSLVALQRSIGAIISVFDCEYIEVAPIAWKSYRFEGYEKNDQNDAICIGLCVIAAARQIQKDLIKGEA